MEHTPWSTFLTSSNIRNPIQAVAATENTEVMSSGFLCELGGSFQKSKLSLFFVIYRQIRIRVGSIYAWTWRLLGKYQMKTWAGYQYECRYTTFLWEKQTYFCISNLFFFPKKRYRCISANKGLCLSKIPSYVKKSKEKHIWAKNSGPK